MRAYAIPLNKMLTVGLRPTQYAPGNGNYLTKSVNFQPFAGRLITVPKIIRSFILNENAQVFDCAEGTFVLSSTTLYSYASGVLTTILSSISAGGRWSHADFGAFLVFSNGTVNLIRHPITGDFSIDTGTRIPLARAICRFRGRLVIGGIIGEDESLVKWSEIGNIRFQTVSDIDTLLKGTSGSASLYEIGDILAIHNLANHSIVVYGIEGVTTLIPNPVEKAPGAMKLEQKDFSGTISGDAVVGSFKEHYFISPNLRLNKLFLKDGAVIIQDLRFEEFITAGCYLSYNRNNGEVIIGKPATSPFLLGDSLIVNQFGVGEISSFIQSAVYTRKGEYVVHSTNKISQLDGLITSDVLEYDHPGFKTVEWIELSGRLSDSIYVALSYKATSEGDFSNSDWIPINSFGAAYMGITGTKFKLHIAVVDYTDTNIERISTTIAFADKRFAKGARTDYGNKTVAEPNS